VGNASLKETLDALKHQVCVGKSYLELAKGLLEADPAVLHTGPTFFGLTTDGGLQLAQLVLARLYDRTLGAVTVRAMLYRAAQQIDTFQSGDQNQIRQTILKSTLSVTAIQPVLDSIRHRRNKWLAHIDEESIRNPKALAEKAKLTISDLERAFKATEDILLDICSLYDRTIGELRFLGGDDYKTALDWIRKAKCIYIERYEEKYGAGSWIGPRPKDCSRRDYDLL
jgi:hypothetical protein